MSSTSQSSTTEQVSHQSLHNSWPLKITTRRFDRKAENQPYVGWLQDCFCEGSEVGDEEENEEDEEDEEDVDDHGVDIGGQERNGEIESDCPADSHYTTANSSMNYYPSPNYSTSCYPAPSYSASSISTDSYLASYDTPANTTHASKKASLAGS